jgi:hypothetical protein
VCALLVTQGARGGSTLANVKNDRRERTTRAPGRRPSPEGSERRSPAFYATRRDVGWLVALLTLIDTGVKLAVKLL